MRVASVSIDGELSLKRTYYDRLKGPIIDKLPATYGGHNNSNNLKSFSVRMTRGEHNCFVVIAIANLGFPKSLARDFDIVLEDKFIEIASNVGALDVMEQLQGEAKRRNEKGKKASLFMAATAST